MWFIWGALSVCISTGVYAQTDAPSGTFADHVAAPLNFSGPVLVGGYFAVKALKQMSEVPKDIVDLLYGYKGYADFSVVKSGGLSLFESPLFYSHPAYDGYTVEMKTISAYKTRMSDFARLEPKYASYFKIG